MPFQNDLTASIASGIVSRIVVQPIDVVKIRIQTSQKSTPAHKVIHSIWKNERGILGFFKGHATGQLLYLAWAIEAPIFYYVNAEIIPESKFASGIVTGCICAASLTWLDSLRTNLANIKTNHRAKADLHTIWKATRGIGLFQGIVPGMIMYGPGTAILFTCYHKLRDELQFQSQYAGFIAGVAVRVILCPLDVTKKRMQIQSLEERQRMVKVARGILQKEGASAFWKGAGISVVKSGIGASVRFMVLDNLRIILNSQAAT